jgi:molybdate transport system substrate-binding protein
MRLRLRTAVIDRRYRGARIALLIIGSVLGICQARPATPAKVSVAAAANLVYVLDALNAEFKRSAPAVAITSTTGASGSLFAQIKNGAPFDLFMSADLDYPKQAVADGLADAKTLRTFATGRLVLWTTRNEIDVTDLAAVIRDPRVSKIALAQPKSAPYGRAAQATMEKLGVRAQLKDKLVFGESISQTAQFVETGNADLGFVAMSLVLSPRLKNKGRWQEVPAELHAGVSLHHAVVLTARGSANPAAKQYLEFLGSDAAKKILREFGYGTPE